MSRLESFIRRLDAQRRCLDWAATEIAARPGAALELGLGNGRTYDHLRERLGSGRDIYAFDRQLAAHPDCVPAAERLVLGELRVTLPAFAARGIAVALVHADLGSGDREATAALAAWLGPWLGEIAAPGALVLSDQRLTERRLLQLDPPASVPEGRYFAYRRA